MNQNRSLHRVILSTNEHGNHIEFWPLVAAAWKKYFNVPVTLAFVTRRGNDDFLVAELRKHGEVVLFPEISGIPSQNRTKVARYMLAARYPQDICLINDIDMLPLQAEYYLDLLKQKSPGELLAVGAELYKNTPHEGKFRIANLTAEGSCFQSLINPKQLSEEALLESWKGLRLFDHKEAIDADPAVFSDESLLRALISQWKDKNKVHHVPLGYYPYTKRALDRAKNWNIEIGKLKDGTYVEAHLLRPFSKYRTQIMPLAIWTFGNANDDPDFYPTLEKAIQLANQNPVSNPAEVAYAHLAENSRYGEKAALVSQSILPASRELPVKSVRDLEPSGQSAVNIKVVERLPIAIVTETMNYISGGVRCIAEVLNRISKQGYEASCYVTLPDLRCEWLQLNFPIRHASQIQLFKGILVSPYSPTAALVSQSHARGKFYWVHSYEPKFPELTGRSDTWRVMSENSYRLPGMHYFAVSSYVKMILELIYKRDVLSPLAPGGVDIDLFRPVERNNKPLRVMFLNREHAFRGSADIIAALRELKVQGINLDICAMGQPIHVPDLQIRHYPPLPQEEFARLLASADIFVHASHFEGFGLPPLEAMACKCAVISTYGGASDYLLDGYNALVVPPKRPDKIANALLRLIADAKLRMRLAEGGYQTVTQNYTWDHTTEHFIEAIEEGMARQSKIKETSSPTSQAYTPVQLKPVQTQDAQSWLLKAEQAFNQGNLEVAKDNLRQAVTCDPRNSALLETLGSIHFQLGDFDASMETFKQLCDLQPKNADALVKLAMSALKINRIDIYENALGKALEINPEHYDGLKLLADINLQLGKYPDAALVYGRILTQKPNDVSVLLALGKCFAHTGDLETSQICYEEVLKSIPNEPVALENLSAVKAMAAKKRVSGLPKTEIKPEVVDDSRFYVPGEGVLRVDRDRWNHAQEQLLRSLQEITKPVEPSFSDSLKRDFHQFEVLRGHVFNRVIELGCRLAPSLSAVLDAAHCGNIDLLDPLAPELEKHPQCQYAGRKLKNNPVNLIPSSIEDFVYEGTYDLVLAVDFLEHCFDAPLALQKIRCMLKPGGTLILREQMRSGEELDPRKDPNSIRPLRINAGMIQQFLKEHFEIKHQEMVTSEGSCLCVIATMAAPGKGTKVVVSPEKSDLQKSEKVPKVTAIVSTYNSERFIRGCLEDLEAQTIAEELEIIVVDTGSPQQERKIVAEFQQRFKNIQYLRTEQRETVYGAWNRGIRAARGKYLTNANADDRHRPDAYEILARSLDENPGIGLVYADCVVTRTENETFETAHPTGAFRWLDFSPRDLLIKGCFVGPQPMWRREIHDQFGLFDAAFVSSGDYEFWLRIASSIPFLHIKETLGLYLESASSVEHANREKAAGESQEAQRRHREEILRCDPSNSETKEAPIPSGVISIELPESALIARLKKGYEFFQQKQYRAAWDYGKSSLEKRPYHPECYVMMGEAALEVGDVILAQECGMRAITMAPKFELAQQFIQSLPKKGRKQRVKWDALPAEKIGYNPNLDLSCPHRPTLTVCIIVKNEEQFIGQCLASVKNVATQIIVVDTGSQDKTVEIAQKQGAEVYHFEWNDNFSDARNKSLEHATGDWILILDADEELPASEHQKLLQDIYTSGVIGYRLPLINQGLEEHGMDYVPRLFRNAPGLFFVSRVHEQVFPSVSVRAREWGLGIKLGTAVIRHHGYNPAVVKDRQKTERNLRLLEQAIEEMPNEPNLLMGLGLELARTGNLDQGILKYQEAFRAMSNQPAHLVVPELREALLTQMGAHLMQQKNFPEIIHIFTAPLALNYGLTSSMHYLFGLALLQQREFSRASEHFEQCVAKRDEPVLTLVLKEIRSAAPHHCMANCHIKMGNMKAAGQAFENALKDDPQSRPVRIDYARFLHHEGRSVEALRALHGVISDYANDLQAWELGAQISLSKPDFLEVALDWTEEAVKIAPDNLTLRQQRAETLLLNQTPERALEVWQHMPKPWTIRDQAAMFICELAKSSVSGTDLHSSGMDNANEFEESKEFIRWYKRLVNYQAVQVLESVHKNMPLLRNSLPSAARVLEAVLVEVDN